MALYRTKSLYTVPYDELELQGVQRLFIDYDNTLCTKSSSLPSKKIVSQLKQLKKQFELLIVSNNKIFVGRRKNFFLSHNIKYVSSFKPFWAGFMHHKDVKTVLIGDKWLTDGLYGFLYNIDVYLVEKVK